MTNYTYNQIISKAKECNTNLKKDYKNGISTAWSYYFAKAVLTPKKDIKKITIGDASAPTGDSISRGISKSDYTELATRYCKWIESNKKLPNYLTYRGLKIHPRLLTSFFAKVLVNNLPKTQSINSKWYTKPVEYKNEVYKYFVQKTGKAFKTLDDLLEYVLKYFKYEKYFDDKKSNKEVIDSKAGNCTDLLQFLINMASEMGYEWKCIHVKCKTSGDGHVYGKFRHKIHTENTWITRDIACVANKGGIKCVWCSNGIVLATNPNWFMANLNR